MEEEIVNTLFGGQTKFSNCAGYCRRHGKYMTVKIIHNKGCLGKQCKWLDKKEHPYWVIRANKKANKKAKKEA